MAAAPQEDVLADPSKTFTRLGQQMPSVSVTTLDGTRVNLAELRGKVVLINFWATWCRPCTYEMPLLEKEIWQKYKSPGFVMIAIAREESEEAVAAFRKKHGFSFPLAADPKRAVYGLFASEGIPRTYVAGTDGRILFQSVGFSSEEFARLKGIVKRELSGARSSKKAP